MMAPHLLGLRLDLRPCQNRGIDSTSLNSQTLNPALLPSHWPSCLISLARSEKCPNPKP